MKAVSDKPVRAGMRQTNRESVRLMHNMRHAGIRSVQSVQGLLVWNAINLILIMLPLVVPLGMEALSKNLRYVMFSSVLCSAISWWRLQVPIRLIWPIRFTLLLQIWFTICCYMAAIDLGRTQDLETSNYFLVMAVIFYFQGSIFGYYWTKLRTWVLNFLLVLITISALVGFAQFLKVGPALKIAEFYNQFQPIDAWGGGKGIRAIGLASWPEFMAFQGLMGWGIIVARLFQRPLKGWEFSLAGFFLLVAYMAQSRIMYVSIFIATALYFYFLIKQDRKRGPLLLVLFAVGILSLFWFGQERLAYVLNTNVTNDPTLRYRQETGWMQAFRIYGERPWTGIGPDNKLVWEVGRTVPDKWTQGHYIDNGYLLLVSWGGLPAIALFIPIILTALGGCIMILRSQEASIERKQMAFICLVCTVSLLNNTFLNNGFTHTYLNCVIFYLAGLAQPSFVESQDELAMKLRVRKKLINVRKSTADVG